MVLWLSRVEDLPWMKPQLKICRNVTEKILSTSFVSVFFATTLVLKHVPSKIQHHELHVFWLSDKRWCDDNNNNHHSNNNNLKNEGENMTVEKRSAQLRRAMMSEASRWTSGLFIWWTSRRGESEVALWLRAEFLVCWLRRRERGHADADHTLMVIVGEYWRKSWTQSTRAWVRNTDLLINTWINQ